MLDLTSLDTPNGIDRIDELLRRFQDFEVCFHTSPKDSRSVGCQHSLVKLLLWISLYLGSDLECLFFLWRPVFHAL